ncbi:MAG: phosphoribosyl-AMP cyclohydrolase [bacterium]
MNIMKMFKFDSKGLIPAIIQDYKKKDVLMLAYMNKEALKKTLDEKKVCFFSRSRNTLWIKGEKSGNCQMVKSIWTDCDADVLLIEVEQIGGAACHTGYRSCFFNKIAGSKVKITGKKVFDPKKVYSK